MCPRCRVCTSGHAASNPASSGGLHALNPLSVLGCLCKKTELDLALFVFGVSGRSGKTEIGVAQNTWFDSGDRTTVR